MNLSSETVRNLYLLAIAVFTCATAFINLKTKRTVEATKVVADKTHVIVNAQKTAMMQKLVDAQKVNLLLAQVMLADKPGNQKLKEAVAAAQALLDASLHDLEIKQQES